MIVIAALVIGGCDGVVFHGLVVGSVLPFPLACAPAHALVLALAICFVSCSCICLTFTMLGRTTMNMEMGQAN